MRRLYASQFWSGSDWRTAYLSSFRPDAEEAFDNCIEVNPTRQYRLVSFTVSDLDFVATQATNYEVIDTFN
nr:MetaGeneMark_Unknown Function [uncultured bacterium]